MDYESWDLDTRIKVDRLVDRLIEATGESEVEVVLTALGERLTRLTEPASRSERTQQVLNFLEASVWPRRELGRELSSEEEKRILGYGPEGV